MKVAIIEDEKVTARNLVDMIRRVKPDIIVEKTMHSVKEALAWFRAGGNPDYLLTDIELADGTCFDIFRHVTINIPVIFTTAYENYALEAFRNNGLAYLLKPYDLKSLGEALEKAGKLSIDHFKTIENLGQQLSGLRHDGGQKTILVRNRERIIPISAQDISFFLLEYGRVSLTTMDGRTYLSDLTLDLIEGMSLSGFARLNRQAIVNRRAVLEALHMPDRRIKLRLAGHDGDSVVVSKEKAPSFLSWLAGR